MGAAVLVRAQIAGEARDILARHLAEAAEIVGEARRLRVDHRIGAIGGDDAALPAAIPDRLVMVERIERAFGGGDELDLETLEERARAEGVGLQRGVDRVVIEVGGGRLEPHVEPEHFGEHPVEPHPRRRAAEQVIVLGEDPPDRAAVLLGRAAVAGRDAERVERHALAVEHAEHIMVRHDQQLRRDRGRPRWWRTRPDRCARAG